MIRRGLTLLEVLAAAALLAVIAAACLPMLAEGTRWKATQRDPAWFDELAILADHVIAAPEAYGLDAGSLSTPGFIATMPSEVVLSINTDGVMIRALEPGLSGQVETAPGHTWIEFIAGNQRVLRFIETGHTPDPSP